jgi:hypothetical protein
MTTLRGSDERWSELDRFVGTDPRGVGCAEAMEMLHV